MDTDNVSGGVRLNGGNIMSYEILKKGDGYQRSNVCTFMTESAEDLDDLPGDIGPGSICYTADMSLMYMYGLDGEWHEV